MSYAMDWKYDRSGEVRKCLGICTLRGCPEQMKRGVTNRDKAGNASLRIGRGELLCDQL